MATVAVVGPGERVDMPYPLPLKLKKEKESAPLLEGFSLARADA